MQQTREGNPILLYQWLIALDMLDAGLTSKQNIVSVG